MHEQTYERARELGRMLGQTAEYKAVKTARDRLSDNRTLVEGLNKLAELETKIARALQRGEEPSAEVQDEYETSFSTLQVSPEYQSLVASQTNFEKLLARVNEEITKGIEAGAQSRIILPS
jgi:cell fate (sporulation/competence/biofilm development) regulator YlbF (YheA/YmcA/DUF963 family)